VGEGSAGLYCKNENNTLIYITFDLKFYEYILEIMEYPIHSDSENKDLNAQNRKKDHIDLAFKSRMPVHEIDHRFYYEPMMSAHPQDMRALETHIATKAMKAPIWVSSMTGGTKMASVINANLARACGEFGLGMGLGSCRQLLFSDEYLGDFQVRKWMGDQPLFANLGVAQVERLIENNQLYKISELIHKLDADGLIVHVNPIQEWLQPEGDRYKKPPLQTIETLLERIDINIIVKEVGQGMGPESLTALLHLPLTALEFAASGGTNFALIELFRSSPEMSDNYQPLAHLGHSAEEMILMTNNIVSANDAAVLCKQIIISGGVTNYLDGYYLTEQSILPAIYGQASGFLKHAMGDYETLHQYVSMQLNGLLLAKTYLKIK